METTAERYTTEVFEPKAPGFPNLSSLQGFSDDDITDNEMGALSPAQNDRLRAHLREMAIGDALGFLLMFGVVIILSHGNLINLLVGCCVGVLVVVNLTKHWRDIGNGKVLAVDGFARKVFIAGGEDPDRYLLTLSAEPHGQAVGELETDAKIHAAVVSGGPCRVFYAPETKMVVAIRPLDGWRPIPEPGPQTKSSIVSKLLRSCSILLED
jgi:hypothetical protein